MLNSVFWHILQVIIFICPCSFFIIKVFESRLRVKKRYYWLTAAGLTALVSVIVALTLTEVSPYPNLSFLGIDAIIIAFIFSLFMLFERSGTSLLFIFFVFLNVQYNSFLMANATLDFGFFPKIFKYEHANTLIVASVYNILLLVAIYHLLVKMYKRIIDDDMAFTHLWYLFALPAGIFFSIQMLMSVVIPRTVAATKGMLLPLIAITICEISSYYAVLSAIIATYNVTVEKGKTNIAKAHLALWQQQYDTLQTKIDLEAQSRHDWKHHIISVLDFVDKDNMAGLRCYLADYRKKYLLNYLDVPICDVSSLNVMFDYYTRQAKDLNIDICITKTSFENCRVAHSDLTVLFGNLLENAIDACKKENISKKCISLKIDSSVTGMMAVICENSFDGVIDYNEYSEIKSRKENGGIGLFSIKSIADKYNGTVEVKIIDNLFKIYVSLQ